MHIELSEDLQRAWQPVYDACLHSDKEYLAKALNHALQEIGKAPFTEQAIYHMANSLLADIVYRYIRYYNDAPTAKVFKIDRAGMFTIEIIE